MLVIKVTGSSKIGPTNYCILSV